MPEPAQKFDAANAQSRQFGLATLLGLMFLAAIGFALARYFEFGSLARQYGLAFRRSPGYSTINLAVYVLVVWRVLIFFRRQILETRPIWPMNGAFFGTLCGATLFASSLAYAVASDQNPLLCVLAIVFCGLCGVGWGVLPTVLVRVLIEPWSGAMQKPMRGAAVGAVLGAASGYFAAFPIALESSVMFLVYGAVPAAFGAVCGARGAYVQAVVHGDRNFMTPEMLERLRKRMDGLPEWDGPEATRLPAEPLR